MNKQQIAQELVKLAKALTAAKQTPFEKALEKAIAKEIKNLKKDGTTGMGMDNLMQVVKPPSASLEGAPKGTNARYYYKEMFRDIAKGFRFVKASGREAMNAVTKKELEEAWFAVMEAKGVLGRVTYPQTSERAVLAAVRAAKVLEKAMGEMVKKWTDD